MKARGIVTMACVSTVAAAAGALAYAAIPGSNGVIHACYKTVGGQVRLVESPAECLDAETATSWNQTGPPGSDGIAGPTSVSRVRSRVLTEELSTLVSHTITSTEAGRTLIWIWGRVIDSNPGAGARTRVSCGYTVVPVTGSQAHVNALFGQMKLYDTNDPQDEGAWGESEFWSAFERDVFTPGDKIEVRCRAANGDGGEAFGYGQLMLARVGS